MFEPLINVICQLNFNAVFLLPDHFGGFWYAFFLFCSTLCNLRAFSSVSSYSYTFFLQALNAKTPQIESGFVNVQFSTTVRTYKITFKNPFQEPPVIQLTVYSGQYGAHARAMITGITTIGFEFGTYDNDSSSASGSVYWLAIDKS